MPCAHRFKAQVLQIAKLGTPQVTQSQGDPPDLKLQSIHREPCSCGAATGHPYDDVTYLTGS